MMSCYIPDVGDGLAAGICTISGVDVQIDCGSQQQPQNALLKGLVGIHPDVFILSHFHVDHYNGLFHWQRRGPWPHPTIGEVYFPRIPEFPDQRRFALDLLAMIHRVMGDVTGSMEADFLSVLSRINRRAFTYRSVSLGDNINVKGSEFKVLWPPKLISDQNTLKAFRKAISDFDSAMEEDKTLRRIYQTIGETGKINPYISDEQQGERPGCGDDAAGDRLHFPIHSERKDLPVVVRRANRSLREAANRISLAFHEDNRLLFMGDLEGHEIKAVAGELKRKTKEHFLIMITPHHGTHWHEELRNLRTCWAVSSVGEGLFKKASSEYRRIAETCLFTYLTGDVRIPPYLPWLLSPRWLRY